MIELNLLIPKKDSLIFGIFLKYCMNRCTLDIWNDEIIFVIGIDRNIRLIITVMDFNSQFFSNTRENKVQRVRVVEQNINNK